MLTIYPRRLLRRPILIGFTIFTVLIVLVYLNTHGRASAKPGDTYRHKPVVVPPKTPVLVSTVTVTKIRTAWARTTRTVMADGADHTPMPPSEGGANDEGGVHAEVPLQRPLGEHVYRQDGLLQVNPDGPHPIFGLVRRAEQEWEAKLNRASKTLEEAVTEYKRRYKRPPPLGFGDW